jgi:hypothetical protein
MHFCEGHCQIGLTMLALVGKLSILVPFLIYSAFQNLLVAYPFTHLQPDP